MGGLEHRWLTVLFGVATAVLAVLLTLSLSFGGAFLPRSTPTASQILTLTGVDRHIVYLNNTEYAIGPVTNDSCPQCPMSFSAGTMVSMVLLTFRINTTFPEVALHIFMNSTIPAEPFGGYSCANSGSCAPPAVTSSTYILIYSNGEGGTWGITFDPPQNATVADNGGVMLTVYSTTCSTVNTDWNYCG